jgi:hypothetical protein
MGALAMASSRFAKAADYSPDNFGVQLYVLRALLAKDFDGTLAKVAAIGIKKRKKSAPASRTRGSQQAVRIACWPACPTTKLAARSIFATKSACRT